MDFLPRTGSGYGSGSPTLLDLIYCAGAAAAPAAAAAAPAAAKEEKKKEEEPEEEDDDMGFGLFD